MQGLQHLGQAHGVVAVVAFGPVGGVAHPVQVGARAERPARAADEDHPHPVGALQGLERLIQGGDGRGVERVLLLRPIDGDEDDAVDGRVDLHQVVVRIRRRINDEGMGDGVHLRRLGVGDVESVQLFLGRLLVGHGRLLQGNNAQGGQAGRRDGRTSAC
ncbi:hypothetical protein D3C80_1535090 [compost metagenome]